MPLWVFVGSAATFEPALGVDASDACVDLGALRTISE
jgi:hypothetical protein